MGQEIPTDRKRTKASGKRRQAPPSSPPPFPIVGVGASAGGLEAFSKLVEHLPTDIGMGVVFVQHLAPHQPSALTEILSRVSKLPVSEAAEGTAVEPNHVYIIPPGTHLSISGGVLHLVERTRAMPHLPIDSFLTALAADRKDAAVGVILSGGDSDGTLGIKAIKAEGGFTFAQDESAKHDSMPQSAIASGFVDFVLPPERIAEELARIARHPHVSPTRSAAGGQAPAIDDGELGKIFQLLKNATNVDFSHYKRATVLRRVKRRMVLANSASIDAYADRLHENQAEIEALYQDLLINVTSFFREPETFEILQRDVFPQLMLNRPPDAPLRIWVPACSTGEEAYSHAICATEFLHSIHSNVKLQIFATDISNPALEKARSGKYTEAEVSGVGEERLAQFFNRNDGGYQVKKSLRDICIFARQNIIHDPPFSRLDMISCRNLLIYLDASLQKKLIPIFHYSLLPTGFLVLGHSEGANEFTDLFSLVDRKGRVFASKPRPLQARPYTTLNEWATLSPQRAMPPNQVAHGFDLQREVSRVLLADYTPPGVVVNEDLEIVQFYGHTGPYLDPATGAASLRLLRLAREGLPLELRAALHQAGERNKTVTREGIRIVSGGRELTLSIEVRPLRADDFNRRYFLVLFHTPADGKAAPRGIDSPTPHSSEILSLTQQLDQNKVELQDMIEQFALRNEELQTANEEIQSNNEELQSTNEELETAKEELQATNEELTTLNDELRNRNQELSVANSDLSNVIANVDFPILIVGADLRIRRFNPSAASLFSLIPTDVGRPITDLRSALEIPGLEALITSAIQSKNVKSEDTLDRQGRWHSLCVRPYMAGDDRIEGAVLTLVDITEVKAEAVQARAYMEAIVGTVRDSILLVDADLKVKAANRAYFETFRASREETIGRRIRELGNGQWNSPSLLRKLKDLLPTQTEIRDFEVENDFPVIGRRTMHLNASPVLPEQGPAVLILLTIEDITERKRSTELLETQSRLIELAHDAIIVRDSNSAVKSWNLGATRLYGWTREEAAGKNTHEFFQTRFPGSAQEVQRKLMQGGEWSGELIHTTKGGNRVIVASYQVMQRDPQGKPQAILEINRDITQHRKAETALRSSEARLRALVSSMDDIVYELDAQGQCLSAWTGDRRLLAQKGKNLPKHRLDELLPMQSSSLLRKSFERVLKTGDPENIEYSLDLDGKRRWFLARINRITSPESSPQTASILVRDITPRKEAQIALLQSEERFRQLVEDVKDYAIFALDTKGHIVSWNTGAQRIKGYTREEVIGRHFSVFYPPEDLRAGKPRRALEIAARQGVYEDPGGWRVRKDGSRFFADVVITALRDKQGLLRGFTKVTRDITERRQAEDAIRQLSGHILELQDEERRRIARDLHDSTAQLLAALSMDLNLALRRPSVTGDREAVRLLTESEGLATQASAEVRGTSHLLHPPDLEAVGLVAAIRWYAGRFRERTGIVVRLKMDDDLCRLPQANEIALFRVAQESLTNVQRHSGSKSAAIKIVHDNENDLVVLTITDQGHGVKPGILDHAPQSIVRLGVGIAGMRERLKQLGGELVILSSPKGTRVRATIPCPSPPKKKGSKKRRNK